MTLRNAPIDEYGAADLQPKNRAGRLHGGPRSRGGATRDRSTKAVLLSLQQASAEYGPPTTSLRDLVMRGHLPSVRLGDSRRIWVLRTDIEKLIERSVERR